MVTIIEPNIDIVILWVDGSDPEWLKEFNKYSPNKSGDGLSTNRFRDWELLPFWFRSIEKCCPWFRKIHFVTWGHTPKWLNLEHPQLTVHTHKDIFPDPSVLPVFNASAIELNINKIDGLSEKFIYFNDDCFILKKVDEERFFVNDMPVDFLIESCPRGGKIYQILKSKSTWTSMINNSLNLINDKFSKRKLRQKKPELFFNRSYGFKYSLINKFFSFFDKYIFIKHYHFAQPYCKSTLDEAWDIYENDIKETSASRFREHSNISQALFRYLHLAKGDFYPACYNDHKIYTLSNLESVKNCIKSINDYTLVCLNDEFNANEEEFELMKNLMLNKMKTLFPIKSSFEC